MTVPRGWKASATLFTTFCALVFLTNLSILIWAATHKHGPSDTTLVLRTGANAAECAHIQNLNKWGHLLINVLSTVLLSGSNYCMQCLSAPTRADINAAHRRGKWLDVGVPSIHNLVGGGIERRRTVLWVVLGLSSLPLHLFYNSAVFTSTSSNNYAVFSVDSAFMNSTATESSNYADMGYLLRSGFDTSRIEIPIESMVDLAARLREQARDGLLVNLTREDCVTQYTKSFQSAYRNVLLVSDGHNAGVDFDQYDGLFWNSKNSLNNNATDDVSFLYARFYSDFTCAGSQAFDWTCIANGTAAPDSVCDPTCDDPKILKSTLASAANNSWAPLGSDVSYCLAEPTDEQCSLEFSMGIAVLVVVLNLVKLCTMAATVVWAFDDETDPPLLTMGDAVASFLTNRDTVSKGMCLVGASQVKRLGAELWHKQAHAKVVRYEGNKPRQRWLKAVSARRWTLCLVLYMVALSTAAGYLGTGLKAMVGSKTLASLWAIGFGTPSGRTLVQSDATQAGKASLTTAVVLANIPQLVLSVLYFTYNGLFTCMLLASEWNSYSVQRKGLRISSSRPVGAQRSGYFLQLPYRFSVPLVVFSLLFHWLISQSIFVVNISMFDADGAAVVDGPNYIGHLVTCGYSPIAIIFSLVLGFGLVTTLVGFGVGMRFRTCMPIAGSCSITIAAACHPLQNSRYSGTDGSEDGEKATSMAQQPLMWGEVEIDDNDNDDEAAAAAKRFAKPLPPYPRENPTQRTTPLPLPPLSLESDDRAALLAGHSNQLSKNPDASSIPQPAQGGPGAAKGLGIVYSSSSATPDSDTDSPVIGHCTFSASPVTTPVTGRYYA